MSKTFTLNPDFTTEVKQCCNVVKTIDNDYLQKWAELGAFVMCIGKDFWVMTGLGHLLFKIRENELHLECVSVNSDERRQGQGTKLMQMAVQLAKDTDTTISLEVAKVEGNGYMMAQAIPISVGINGSKKIPVGQLPAWYEKFGFVKTDKYTVKKREMIFRP